MRVAAATVLLTALKFQLVTCEIFCYLQISTLVQHRSERPHITSATSERTLRAIGRVGQAVNLAVERFVTVGEAIADDNHDIKQDMYDACKEARAAGELLIAFFFITDGRLQQMCVWLLLFFSGDVVYSAFLKQRHLSIAYVMRTSL